MIGRSLFSMFSHWHDFFFGDDFGQLLGKNMMTKVSGGMVSNCSTEFTWAPKWFLILRSGGTAMLSMLRM